MEDSYSPTEEEHCHKNTEEDSEEEEGPCKCAQCFKRRIAGAADVVNAKRRLMGGLEMQQHFIEKHKDKDKPPKTFETRKRLRDYFLSSLREFDTLFADQLPEYAAEFEEDPEVGTRKRKRK